MRLLLPSLISAVLLAAPALPAQADPLDDAIAGFTGAAGWQPGDAGAMEQALIGGLSDPRSVSPGGSLGPLEKALLLAEQAEPALPRTRTLLRYGQITLDDNGAPLPVSFVQVERYNLGPATRVIAIEDFGEENVAAPEEFGVGPHVAWRFVFIPLMGSEAALLDAARRDLPEAEAAAADCLGRGCLDLMHSAEDAVEWLESEAPPLDFASPYEERREGLTVMARAVAELSLLQGLATLEGGQYLWTGVEQPEAAAEGQPFLYVLEDRGIGQEVASETLLVQTQLNDDSLSAFWSRRLELPDEVYWFGAGVKR